MRSPRLVAVAVALSTVLGCQGESKENPHAPNGKFIKQLDARGRRHLLQDGNGKSLAKLRVRKDRVRVYDAQMLPVGELQWDGGKLRISREQDAEESLPAAIKDVAKLKGMRIEAVERGWAVFDSGASALGYFEWVDGRLALRDDYSASPRLYADGDDAEARTPAGGVRLSLSPPYPAVVVMPFALNGKLDPLQRVALGMWLQKQAPRSDLKATR